MLPCLVNLRSHPRRPPQFHHSGEKLLFRPDFRPFFSCATHSSKFRTLFQDPYPLSPLLATLAKTAGVCTNSSRFGTCPARNCSQSLSPQLSLAPRPLPLALSLRPQMTIPLSFQTLAHSFALSCTRTNLNSFIFNPFRTLRQKTKHSRQLLPPRAQFSRRPPSADRGTRFRTQSHEARTTSRQVAAVPSECYDLVFHEPC